MESQTTISPHSLNSTTDDNSQSISDKLYSYLFERTTIINDTIIVLQVFYRPKDPYILNSNHLILQTDVPLASSNAAVAFSVGLLVFYLVLHFYLRKSLFRVDFWSRRRKVLQILEGFVSLGKQHNQFLCQLKFLCVLICLISEICSQIFPERYTRTFDLFSPQITTL